MVGWVAQCELGRWGVSTRVVYSRSRMIASRSTNSQILKNNNNNDNNISTGEAIPVKLANSFVSKVEGCAATKVKLVYPPSPPPGLYYLPDIYIHKWVRSASVGDDAVKHASRCVSQPTRTPG